ncbi:ATP-dependent Clp protease ATP-binding subunit [Candidatus Microgenomates bacterium]|nr:ATP-dependent Clp protease ATP-binding subunit [Candidatus Microgenomates bacterium]
MTALPQSTTLFVNCLLYVIYAFALPHHLKTFFSPFKRVAEKSTSPGVNLQEIGEVISYNLVSIGIGMILRAAVILAGLLVLFIAFIILLLLLPLFVSYFALIRRPPKPASVPKKFVQAKLGNTDQRLLDQTDLDRITQWYQNLHAAGPFNLLDRDTVTKIAGFGSDWSYGYTNQLDKFQVSQNTSPYPRVVGRDKEVDAIEKALSKTSQNSVIVAGEPGVGRHAVVDEFARRLFVGNVLPNLVGFRTVYFDLSAALAAKQNPLDLFEEGRSAGNVILVIDNIDKFFDLTDVFNQTLAEGKLRVIGLTSQQLADKLVAQNTSLLKLFTIIPVAAPDIATVFLEMELSIVPVLEKQHQISISYPAIKEAITSADRFISTVPFPEKAINILDEAVAGVLAEHPHMTTLLGQDVDRYLSTKTQIPVGDLTGSDKEKLTNLEDKLHQRIIGQDEAVSAVAKAFRRAVLQVSARNKPVGTFLFLGPTGVGKTETAKALAEVYFGNENRLVRFDMSEYQGEVGLERLLATLPVALVDNPFAVVLFDEIEKAPPIITNLFLTLIDEGYITDTANRKVSAKQNIIIATSNAGERYEQVFSPEFRNRFDGIIFFQPLNDNQIREVAKKLLAGVATRVAEKKITLEFSGDLIDRIIKDGYQKEFGARSIRRYIQDIVEDEISQKLLSDSYPPGSKLRI